MDSTLIRSSRRGTVRTMKHPALLLLSALLLLTGCTEGTDQTDTSMVADPAEDLPEQQFFDYRLIESAAGVRQWVLESDEMQKFSGQRPALLITVNMDFYRDGEYFSTLTADSGRANLQTKDIHTWGNVVVVTRDGRRLETSELFFSNETQLIHNDVFDRFTREDDVVTGIGLEATPDLEYIEIKQRVEAEVSDETSTEGDAF